MTRNSKIAFAFLLALLLGFSGGAQATSFNLGNVSGPTQFSIGNQKLPGPFLDKFHFTIDPGVSLNFSAFANTGPSRHDAILDMEGTLSDASGVILNADAVTVITIYPDRQLTFPSTLLGPGHYFLSIFGTETSDVSIGGPYTGTLTFAATPLPGALLLMLTALGGFGLLGWRRKAASLKARCA